MPHFSPLRLFSMLALSSALAAPIHAQGLAGPYLASRHANFAGEFSASVEYGTRALARDPDNIDLMQGLLVAQIGLGQFEQAVPVARRLDGLEENNQIAGLVLLADMMQSEDWAAVLDALADGITIGGGLDHLVQAWALVGAGQVSEALRVFASMEADAGLGQTGSFHRAMLMAAAGDFEAAALILSGESEGALSLDRAGIIAYVQVLSQLERNPDALQLLVQTFPSDNDAEIEVLKAELAAGKPVAFEIELSPRRNIATVFAGVAQSLMRDVDPNVALIYSRTAEYLEPTLFEATYLSASLLESMDLSDLAIKAFGTISDDHRLYLPASLARAKILRRNDQPDVAIEVLEALARAFPDKPEVHEALGDTFRFQKRFEEASQAYDRAIALFETPTSAQWPLFFARGITHEREGRWPQAEADFRKALKLNPEQPTVLNYLGYSYVEKQQNLDEALDMIERAVAARPGDGFITDSLGWVFYRLGRYEDAVAPMERAIELEPVDPVINDHLGDVYWAVGRRLEAEFQWHRALSFITEDDDPEEINPDRILRKLEVGLDLVLDEEGAEPLIRSNDDG